LRRTHGAIVAVLVVDDAVALRLLRGEIGTIDRVLEDSIRLEYQQSIQISSVLALALSDEGILLKT